MCGIVGYIGVREPKAILIDGLAKLEYRGYDSAGIAIIDEKSEIKVAKEVGKLENLNRTSETLELSGYMGIGHTRWATHGKPSKNNSHPHLSGDERIALVHNGIIENYESLRNDLLDKGHVFLSETDTEVVVHLLEEHYNGNLFETMLKVVPMLEGTYALGVFSRDEKDKLYTVRKGSPLIVGQGADENFIASDVTAILEHTRDIVFLNDGELAVITKDNIEYFDLEGNKIIKKVEHIDWSIEAAEKGGYAHFMLKEINEQPKVIEDTLRGKICGNSATIDELELTEKDLNNIDKISIVACGTSYYAGLVGKNIIEQELRIPVEVDFASEYRYKNPIVSDRDLVLFISQSGETADTLAALREAKSKGAKVLGIINVLGSTISREAHGTLYTSAGPEIGVASTKAFISQLTALYILTLCLGEKLDIMDEERRIEVIDGLRNLSSKVEKILGNADMIKEKATIFEEVRNCMYIGRNINYPIALEGALKLKEISYIHAEAYPSGELKHGPIALIEPSCPTVAIATKSHTYDKVKSNIEEIKAREGRILVLASEGDEDIQSITKDVIYVPEVDEIFSPIINVVPMQLLSYYVAIGRGLDVDKPRNLAKSVTVE
jgi:glucosamine--fructose-6-phosphate aminotransferase (isomerizing)